MKREKDAGRRLDWIDAARGIGMVLVFYGHVLQKAVPDSNASAAAQKRLLYSFVMQFFFVTSGFFFRPPANFVVRVRQLAARRLLPVVFFGLMVLPLWVSGELHAHKPLRSDIPRVIADYLRGRPDLNHVTWFLVCLFVCEVMAVPFLRKIESPAALLTFGGICIFAGVRFSNATLEPDGSLGHAIGDFWFFSEAVVALGLLSIGRAGYPYAMRVAERPALAAVFFVAGTAIVLLTYQRNPTPYGVVMGARQNGDALLFALTGLAGTVACLALGVWLSGLTWLRAIGRNTLPLLGLNGVFLHYLNPRLAPHWTVPDSPVMVFVYGMIPAVVSLALCVPAVLFFNRYLPQLIGKSGVVGPWLPALEPRERQSVTNRVGASQAARQPSS
jgi:fucose 4-O-acetylase-like acetyltransferase